MRKDMVVCQQTCMCVKECMHVKHEIRHAHILYKNMHVCENTCVCNRCTPVVTCMYVNAFLIFSTNKSSINGPTDLLNARGETLKLSMFYPLLLVFSVTGRYYTRKWYVPQILTDKLPEGSAQ